LHYGLTTTAWLTAPSLLILGLGMGTCFFTIYELAIGDIAHNEAGSASGALSAVQQLANAVGSAIVTSVYFDVLAKHGDVRAMTVSVAVVAIIVLLCLPLVGLLPKKASANGEI
jgi:fucose permease